LSDFHHAGSSDSGGYNVLNQIAQTEVFGVRMSKSSPSWRIKWKFIWHIWRLFWVI